MIPTLYRLANLDPGQVKKVRFRAKPHYQRDGTHGSALPVYGHYWFEIHQVYDILEPEINRLQEERILSTERQQVAELTKDHREMFGYV